MHRPLEYVEFGAQWAEIGMLLHCRRSNIWNGGFHSSFAFACVNVFSGTLVAVTCCRDVRSGAVLARSSQPEIGLFGWRDERDEQILQAILAACTLNDGQPSPPNTPNGEEIL